MKTKALFEPGKFARQLMKGVMYNYDYYYIEGNIYYAEKLFMVNAIFLWIEKTFMKNIIKAEDIQKYVGAAYEYLEGMWILNGITVTLLLQTTENLLTIRSTRFKMSNEETETNEEVEVDTTELEDAPESEEVAEASPEQEPIEEEETLAGLPPIFLMPPMGASDSAAASPPPIRTTGIIGAVTEEKAADIIGALIKLVNNGVEEVVEPIEKCKDCACDPACESALEPVVKKVYKPIEFIVSTQGGSAAEMFSIYDMMRHVQKDFEIHTHLALAR